MTDEEAPEPTKIPVYILLRIEDYPVKARARQHLGRLRQAIHKVADETPGGMGLTEIILSSERDKNYFGLDQHADVEAVEEILTRHMEHAKAAIRSRRATMSFEERMSDAQRAENRIAGNELREPRSIRVFNVWIEGYAATGEHGGATPKALYGFDLEDAFRRWRERDDPQAYIYLSRSPGGRRQDLSSDTGYNYWGCRIFTEEADARRSFG